MFAPSRLLARSTSSTISRSSFLVPSTRASSSGVSSSSDASTPTPSPSGSSSSVPSSTSGYYLTAPPRQAVVPISWSRPDATLSPSSPHSTILTDPTNLNLAHHLLPTTLHSPSTLLLSQTQKYIVAKLFKQRLLLHPTDIVTIPRLAGHPALGSQLHLTRIFEVGSRDFTLRAPLGQRLTEIKCTLTVLEHTQAPMSIVHKKKRRKGYQKEIRNKHQFTRLRVGDIEIVGEGGAVAEDEKAPERKLTRRVDMAAEEYRVTDGSMEGKLAVNFGITRPRATEMAPPRPVD